MVRRLGRPKSKLTRVRRVLRRIERLKSQPTLSRMDARMLRGLINIAEADRRLKKIAKKPLIEKPRQLRKKRVKEFFIGFPPVFGAVVGIKRRRLGRIKK